MRSFVRKILLAAMLLTMASAVHAQISIGIRIGPPPPPRVVHTLPPSPGPEFVWVAGYWYPDGGHYKWHEGYWTRPPYESAQWVPLHYDGEHFFVGYWDGPRGRVEHDHRWDRDPDRDYRGHDHNENHEQGR